MTSYSTRTAPTIRGKYLLENILAAPPPAAAQLPALEETSKDGKPRSVREMLGCASKESVCASCRANGSARAESGKFRCDRTVAHDGRWYAD